MFWGFPQVARDFSKNCPQFLKKVAQKGKKLLSVIKVSQKWLQKHTKRYRFQPSLSCTKKEITDRHSQPNECDDDQKNDDKKKQN